MADVSMVAAANTNGNAGKNRVFVCAAPVDGLKFFQLPHPRSATVSFEVDDTRHQRTLKRARLASASRPAQIQVRVTTRVSGIPPNWK